MRTPATLFAAILLIGLSSARADRPAIEKVLADMSQAALAANPDAYLASVSQADAIFYKEQCNWAKDLKRVKPTAVAFTIGEPPEKTDTPERTTRSRSTNDRVQEFGEKKARFEMVTTWTLAPQKEGGKETERSVSFPVVFERTDDGRWLYAGEDWLVLQSDELPPRDDRFQGPDPDSLRHPPPTPPPSPPATSTAHA